MCKQLILSETSPRITSRICNPAQLHTLCSAPALSDRRQRVPPFWRCQKRRKCRYPGIPHRASARYGKTFASGSDLNRPQKARNGRPLIAAGLTLPDLDRLPAVHLGAEQTFLDRSRSGSS